MNSATPGSVPVTAGNVAFIRGYAIESLEAQSRALAVIACRIGDEFEAVVRLYSSIQRPGGDLRHGEVRPGGQEDRGHAGLRRRKRSVPTRGRRGNIWPVISRWLSCYVRRHGCEQ